MMRWQRSKVDPLANEGTPGAVRARAHEFKGITAHLQIWFTVYFGLSQRPDPLVLGLGPNQTHRHPLLTAKVTNEQVRAKSDASASLFVIE